MKTETNSAKPVLDECSDHNVNMHNATDNAFTTTNTPVKLYILFKFINLFKWTM